MYQCQLDLPFADIDIGTCAALYYLSGFICDVTLIGKYVFRYHEYVTLLITFMSDEFLDVLAVSLSIITPASCYKCKSVFAVNLL